VLVVPRAKHAAVVPARAVVATATAAPVKSVTTDPAASLAAPRVAAAHQLLATLSVLATTTAARALPVVQVGFSFLLAKLRQGELAPQAQNAAPTNAAPAGAVKNKVRCWRHSELIACATWKHPSRSSPLRPNVVHPARWLTAKRRASLNSAKPSILLR